ncbi:DNA-3-methyladenine glycosylase 2 family protein [Elizabethkingia miricola]|uniref:DNA-3-methyladenine glycosylase family protein n=1 Tax=Elizabethkingia bruuniana TaxID=1756149 RepID=UPI00099A3EC8|nr:DNA-3-methyladenine glycosylase [Elizabethkingia bruuniana]OPC54820.1 3-methyladenine DNA glycosylase [Elizabethkingia bruuniana]OPC66610.1 3-methyladenine DNA glycosylase [Elizabethkingia bruuniana]RBI91454.1 DNA-3-methyladenine glycosylase 2 family protein [Elizabethkingia miricola]
MNASSTFTSENFRIICDELANNDNHLKDIVDAYGYPPMWTRDNSFETFVHIILEQQVSLASALATLNKLREKLIDISPEKILTLTDEEMKACFVSRQKSTYIRGLARALLNEEVRLHELEKITNEEIRDQLIKLKGIGNWTIDVYLMFVLQRTDLFPIGDLAAVNALKRLKKLESSVTREEIISISENWKPYRTIATMMLWHYYLSSARNK